MNSPKMNGNALEKVQMDSNYSPETKLHLSKMQKGTKTIENQLLECLSPAQVGDSISLKLDRALSVSGTKTFDIKKRPLFIGVTGGTAGGKTSICDM